jgi:hypothetical protein
MEIKIATISKTEIFSPGGLAHLSRAGLGGWGNGYIGIPQKHPWFEKHYDDIPCEVHGGLTYSDHNNPTTRKADKDIWWIGFDTMHAYDNQGNCSKTYVEQEVESMKQQAIRAIESEQKNDQ